MSNTVPKKLTDRQRDEVRRAFDVLLHQTTAVNEHNGWRGSGRVTKGDRIALIHSEASELLEWTRQRGNPKSDHIEATGEAEELADILIRVMDYAEVYGVHLASAVLDKLDYNIERGIRHGGKLI